MDRNERRIIDELFAKLREAEERAPPRDAEADGRIRQHLRAQPAAPYYMAQAIVVQQDALAAAQARIEALEREAAERSAGGFLSGLLGGGREPGRPAPAEPSPGGGTGGGASGAPTAASSPAPCRPRSAWPAASWSRTR